MSTRRAGRKLAWLTKLDCGGHLHCPFEAFSLR